MIDLFGSLITERFTIVDGRAGQTAWKTTNKMKVKHTTEEREREGEQEEMYTNDTDIFLLNKHVYLIHFLNRR